MKEPLSALTASRIIVRLSYVEHSPLIVPVRSLPVEEHDPGSGRYASRAGAVT